MTRTQVSAARVSSIVVMGGIVLASIAIPSWITFETRAGENALRKLGASFSEAKSGGLLVELPTQISDDTLIKEDLISKGSMLHTLTFPIRNLRAWSR